MQFLDDEGVCICPPIIHPPCPPSCSPQSSAEDAKCYQEIGAEMIGNRLTIRMEKDKTRAKRKREWDPPCDCVEIQRPTRRKGPRIINAEHDDRIVFRVHSASRFYGKEAGREEPAYKSQTIAYKMESCRDEQDDHRCKTITVYPRGLSAPGSQEVYSSHITESGQDIFLLKIKKKAESPDQRDRNVELELRSPKPPTPPAVALPAIAPPAITPPVIEPVAELITEDIKESNTIEQKIKPKKRKRKK